MVTDTHPPYMFMCPCVADYTISPSTLLLSYLSYPILPCFLPLVYPVEIFFLLFHLAVA